MLLLPPPTPKWTLVRRPDRTPRLRLSSAASPQCHQPRSFSRATTRAGVMPSPFLWSVQAWRARSSWGSRRAPDSVCRATNSRRSMRASDAIHTRRARRRRTSARISTCEQNSISRSPSDAFRKGSSEIVVVFVGISRRSPYGFRTSDKLWRDLGDSLRPGVLRLPRRLWRCSHLHRQLCPPLLLP